MEGLPLYMGMAKRAYRDVFTASPAKLYSI